MRLRASTDLYELMERLAADRAPRSYLEIGVQDGESLRRVVTASPQLRHLTLCDTWDSSYGGTGRGSAMHITALLHDLNYKGQVAYLNGRSQETLPTYWVGKLDTDRFDLVFVDGDHSEAGALADLINGWAACGDVLVAHDIEFPEVWRAVLAFAYEHAAEARAQVYFGGHGAVVFFREDK